MPPITETPAVGAPAEPVKKFNLVISGETFTAQEVTQARGKGAGNKSILLDYDVTKPDAVNRIIKVVGVERFNRVFFADILRPICNYATQDAKEAAHKRAGEGADFTSVELAAAFLAQWDPEGRKTAGTGKRALHKKKVELLEELAPLFIMKMQNTPFDTAQNTRFAQLVTEYSDIEAKIVAGERKGAKK